LAHYWIWTDGNPLANLGYAGQSTVIEDDAPGIGNVINSAAAYSINYGYRDGAGGARIFTHENGHAMGAVQLSAPDSTGAWHCTDGQDVMCYPDGGPRGSSYSSAVCPNATNGTSLFDCNFNDYWNPAPAPDSYLATHWNLASPDNQWISLQPAASSTSLAANWTTIVPASPVTLTATVTSASTPGPGLPSGSVTFRDGSSALGAASVNSSGQAVLTTSALALGSHAITAGYAGSALYAPSSTTSSTTVTVQNAGPWSTQTSLSAAPGQSVAPGTPVVLSASVSAYQGTPSGTLTFLDGSTPLG